MMFVIFLIFCLRTSNSMPLLEQLKTLTVSVQNCHLEIGGETGSYVSIVKLHGKVFFDIKLCFYFNL